MRTAAVLGVTLLAGGLAVAGLIAWTSLDLATDLVYGFVAMFAVMGGVAILGSVLAVREDRRAERRRDQFDDAIDLVTGPSDAEIEQWISNYPKEDGRG